MKTKHLTPSELMCTYLVDYAQQWGGSQTTNGDINRAGNVTIGSGVVGIERLNIRGNLRLFGGTSYNLYGDVTTGVFGLYGNTNSASGPYMEMYGGTHGTRPGLLAFGSHGATGETWFTHYNTTTNSWEVQAMITANGRFVIVNCTPWVGDYGLYVEKGILASQVKVALPNTNDWSDYVFNHDYKLMPLAKLKTNIAKHKHLPDVPSAQEVSEEGIDLGKMDATLLRKIEELTLYILAQDKKIQELEERVNNTNQK
jgi:hypothetical protein